MCKQAADSVRVLQSESDLLDGELKYFKNSR